MRLILGAVLTAFLWCGLGVGHTGFSNGCGGGLGIVGSLEQDLRRHHGRCVIPSRIAPHLSKLLKETPNLTPEAQDLLSQGVTPLTMTKEMVDIWVDVYKERIEKSSVDNDIKERLLTSLEKTRESLKEKAPSVNLYKDPGPFESPTNLAAPSRTLSEKLNGYMNRVEFTDCVKITTRLFVYSNIINTVGAVHSHFLDYAVDADKSVISNLFTPKFWKNVIYDVRFQQNAAWNFIFMAGYGAIMCMRNEGLGYMTLMGFALTSALATQLVMADFSLRQTLTNLAYIGTISYMKGRGALWAVRWWERNEYPYQEVFNATVFTVSEGIGAWVYPPWDDLTRWACNDPAPPSGH
jgi:hypothetical protein